MHSPELELEVSCNFLLQFHEGRLGDGVAVVVFEDFGDATYADSPNIFGLEFESALLEALLGFTALFPFR